MRIRKFLLSAIAIILVISTLSGCSFFAAKKVLNDSDEVFEEELMQDEKTEGNDDKGLSGLIDKKEEETKTNRDYVEIDTINSVEEFKNLVSPLIDLSDYDVIEYSEGVQYSMKEEPKNQTSYNFRHTVSLGDGTEFTLPSTVGKLKSQGWSVSEDHIETDGYIYMINAENDELKIYIDSSTVGGNIDKYGVNGYVISAYEDNRNIEYTVYDKLTEESDFIEIIEHLGAPTIVKFGITDKENSESKSVELYYLENGSYDKMTKFTISCGTLSSSFVSQDFNGRLVYVCS